MAEKQSLGAMVSGLTQDFSAIVRGEVELAKAEVRQTMQNATRGGGMLAGAGVLGFLGFVFLLVTLAFVIAIWLPVWAGFGIVTLLLVIVAGILGFLGKKHLEEVKGLERAPASIERTMGLFSGRSTKANVTDLATTTDSVAQKAAETADNAARAAQDVADSVASTTRSTVSDLADAVQDAVPPVSGRNA